MTAAVTVAMPSPTASVSLYAEISALSDAVECSRIVLQGLQEAPDGLEGHEGRQLLASGLAGLALIVARLQILRRVLQGEADPERLLTPQNAVPKFAEAACIGDALLIPWTDAKRTEVATLEVERIRTREQSEGG